MSWQTLLIDVLLMPLVAFVVGLGLVLMARKIRARIERRIGPPCLQPLYDIVKLYGKSMHVSHGVMHDLGIVMVLGGYICAELFLPVPMMVGFAEQADLVTLLYLLMVPSLGLALGVGQCANPNGSIGISRALTSMLSYDLPFVIVIVGVAMTYGTTSLPEMIRLQQEGGFSTWGISTMPLLAIAGLMAMHAMLGKEPFEQYVAPAEIATGPMVEMSGKYLGALFTMQAFQLYTVGVLYTTLFLGGGENWPLFLLKVFAVVFISTTVTVLFPRYKIDDATRWLLKWPVSIALVGLLLVML